MSLKYIDIDSTYRDRSQYSNPADFITPVSSLFTDSNNNPVSNQTLIYPTSAFNQTFAYPLVYGSYPTLFRPPVTLNQTTSMLLDSRITTYNNSTITDLIPKTQNTFNNKILELINDDYLTPDNLTISYYTITDTIYKKQTLMLSGIDTIYAEIDSSAPFDRYTAVYLSPYASDIDDYYNNKTIRFPSYFDSFVYEERNIIDYDGGRRLAFLSGDPLPYIAGSGNNFTILTNEYWGVTTETTITPTQPFQYPSHYPDYNTTFARNLFRIRENIPYFSGMYKNISNTEQTNEIHFPSYASSEDNVYTDMYLWINNPLQLVTTGTVADAPLIDALYHEFSTQTITLDIDPSSVLLDDYTGMTFLVRTNWPNGFLGPGVFTLSTVILSSTIINSSSFSIEIEMGFPQSFTIGDSYEIYKQNPNLNNYYQILSYNGSSQIAIIKPSLSGALFIGDTFDIIKITNDCFNPINVNQSSVLDIQNCYECELQSITLPNSILNSGNKLSAYPYIYLEFTSAQENCFRQTLYSNSPYTSLVLFKIPIYGVKAPESASFVVLDGRGMKQTVTMRLHDHFRIRILLPNGEIFETTEPDSQLPLPPNPNLQISITFSMKKN
jgi:hypothetical protein